MKKILKWFSIFVKICGVYLTIFIVSVVLLGFEKRTDTPLIKENYVEYREYLDADSVAMYRSFYGSVHYEIVVDKIDEEKIISRTLLFIQKYGIIEKRFLYLDDKNSLFVVVNDNNEVWTEKSHR